MIDFTFLLVLIVAFVAVQHGLWIIAAPLLLLLLFTARNKALILAVLIGFAVSIFIFYGLWSPWLLIAGLFIILLLLARTDTKAGPEYYPS